MLERRKFLKQLALVGVGGKALLSTGSVKAAVETADHTRMKEWPEMTYKTLGRTGFNASRLVYGCGAALSRKRADRTLNAAFDRGVNVYDVGTSRYYGFAQRHLAEFAVTHRDDIFLVTKDFVDADRNANPSVEETKALAQQWIGRLDACLEELQQEHVDAYYIMGANNPHLIDREEFYNAFLAAKKAGKVSYFGFSTHDRAEVLLEKATQTGWYDLAMLAITPGGWYDWASKDLVGESPNLIALKPVLDRAREAGIGLVGMKAARILAGRMFGGRGKMSMFDEFYNDDITKRNFSAFQRSYGYVLAHGMDVVNSDIGSFDILEENFVAAATVSRLA